MKLTRRTFLKQTGLTAAGWSIAELAIPANLQAASSASQPAGATQRTHSVCGLCPARCLIDGITEDGRLRNIEGNPQDPFTDGKVCARAKAAGQLLYDPDRLKYPLKRVGERGEGKWARISWGEAVDTIVSKMEQAMAIGSEAMALFHNGPSSLFIRELFQELGCRHLNNPAWEMCAANRELAYGQTFGSANHFEVLEFAKAKVIVLLGSHLGENVQVPLLRQFAKARENGAKLIVIDPRFSTIASKADHHLMIRPGTDTALLLGWLRYLLESGLANRQDLNTMPGLESFRGQLSNFGLAEVAAICDLKVTELKATAELLAVAAPAVSIHPGQHSSWYGNDVQRLRAQAILTGILGGWRSWPKPDGKQVHAPMPLAVAHEQLASTIMRKALDGSIKLLACWGQNPFHAHPNPYRTLSAFKKVDFVFCCDIFPTETALYADIILPEASFLERTDIIEIFGGEQHDIAAIRQPLVAPSFEMKDPYRIVKELSSRLGKGERFNYESIAERIESESAELGISWYEMQQKGYARLPKKEAAVIVEASNSLAGVTLFAEELQERGGTALPEFEPIPLPPAGYTRLLYGRLPTHSGSTTANNAWLNQEISQNELWLNDRVAASMGVRDQEQLFLENQDGIRSVSPVTVKVTPGIRVDCVYLPHGFGGRSPFMRQGFNRGVSDASLMTRTTPDTLSGVRGLRGNFVRFVRQGKPLAVPPLDDAPEILKRTRKWWFDSFGSFEKGERRKLYV